MLDSYSGYADDAEKLRDLAYKQISRYVSKKRSEAEAADFVSGLEKIVVKMAQDNTKIRCWIPSLVKQYLPVIDVMLITTEEHALGKHHGIASRQKQVDELRQLAAHLASALDEHIVETKGNLVLDICGAKRLETPDLSLEQLQDWCNCFLALPTGMVEHFKWMQEKYYPRWQSLARRKNLRCHMPLLATLVIWNDMFGELPKLRHPEREESHPFTDVYWLLAPLFLNDEEETYTHATLHDWLARSANKQKLLNEMRLFVIEHLKQEIMAEESGS